MSALKKTEMPENSLSVEQVKLLEYVGDLSQELSQLARMAALSVSVNF